MVSITTDEATNGQTTRETRGSSSKTRLWSGRVISIVLVIFFLFDSIGKILKIDQSVEGSVKLGYPCSPAPSSTRFHVPLSSARSC